MATQTIGANQSALTHLRRQWVVVLLLFGAALTTGWALLLLIWSPAAAHHWLRMALLAVGIQMAILWWAIPFNYRSADERLFPTLGAANGLTISRGLCIAFLAGFLLAPAPPPSLLWAPALLYLFDRLIDFADGWVARRTGRETRLGSVLDIEFDGLGLLIASALAVQYGKLPIWYLFLGLTRPLFVLGMWLRSRQGKPNFEMSTSDYRRLVAGFQTGFVCLTLWPILQAEVTQLAAWIFGAALLMSFGRDWMVVSGQWDATSPGFAARRAQVKCWLEQRLTLAARLMGTGLACWQLWQTISATPELLSPLFITAWLAATAMMAAGIAGRVGAFVLFALFTLGPLAPLTLDLTTGALLCCTILVAHLGSGNGSLWQPEERILRTKLGAPK
jgi:CDP-diacylglycerol---glycerol-3-phosphate 3-phosphatidyltransferase